MCARYNTQGNQIVVLRNRLPISLYNSNNQHELCEFDNFGFYNTITQKSLCFGGVEDEFAIVGSDDFNVYVFKIPNDLKYYSPSNITTCRSDNELNKIRFVNTAAFVLKGHKSIVNQVSYNYQRSIIASSGVERVIKYWTPFSLNLNKKATKKNLSTDACDRQVNNSATTK